MIEMKKGRERKTGSPRVKKKRKENNKTHHQRFLSPRWDQLPGQSKHWLGLGKEKQCFQKEGNKKDE